MPNALSRAKTYIAAHSPSNPFTPDPDSGQPRGTDSILFWTTFAGIAAILALLGNTLTTLFATQAINTSLERGSGNLVGTSAAHIQIAALALSTLAAASVLVCLVHNLARRKDLRQKPTQHQTVPLTREPDMRSEWIILSRKLTVIAGILMSTISTAFTIGAIVLQEEYIRHIKSAFSPAPLHICVLLLSLSCIFLVAFFFPCFALTFYTPCPPYKTWTRRDASSRASGGIANVANNLQARKVPSMANSKIRTGEKGESRPTTGETGNRTPRPESYPSLKDDESNGPLLGHSKASTNGPLTPPPPAKVRSRSELHEDSMLGPQVKSATRATGTDEEGSKDGHSTAWTTWAGGYSPAQPAAEPDSTFVLAKQTLSPDRNMDLLDIHPLFRAAAATGDSSLQTLPRCSIGTNITANPNHKQSLSSRQLSQLRPGTSALLLRKSLLSANDQVSLARQSADGSWGGQSVCGSSSRA